MEPSFEQLLHEALRDGNTAAAAALSRAIEERTRLASNHYSVLTQGLTQQQTFIQATAIPVQAQTIQQASVKEQKSKEVKEDFNWLTFTCSWKMTIIVLYIAIAEVLNPGHQGLLKLHQIHWFWGPRAIAGLVNIDLPKPQQEEDVPQTEDEPVTETVPQERPEVAEESTSNPVETIVERVNRTVESQTEPQFAKADTLNTPSVTTVKCEDNSAKFSIGAANFSISNVVHCYPGLRRQGSAIAVLSESSLVDYESGGMIQNYTRDDLREFGLLK
jgi:hypothetical protein